MTTHDLATALLKEPNVPIHIEGWTSENIKIVQPLWAQTDPEDTIPTPDARILVNADYYKPQ